MIPEALAAARLRAANERPYLAAALWSLIPVARPGLRTMGVDRYYRLYYDEQKLSEWSVVETAAVLIHEITHLLRDHPDRAAEMQVEKTPWFYATDIAINDDMVNEGLPLPGGECTVQPDGKLGEGFLVPKTFGMEDGDIEESYYAELMDRADQKGEGGGLPDPHGTPQPGTGAAGQPGSGAPGQPGEDDEEGEGSESSGQGQGEGEDDGEGEGQGQGDGEGEGQGEGDGEGEGQNPCSGADGEGEGEGQGKGQGDGQGEGEGGGSPANTGGGMCGSCAGGSQQPWEDDAPGEKGASDGLKPAEQKLVQRHVAQATREASKSRGDVPGQWATWAEEVLTKKVPWTQLLMGALRGAVSYASGMMDYTYSRPSRRQGSFPKIVLPALRAPKPQGAFVQDTSGSMSDEDMGACFDQITDCIKQVGFPNGVPVIAVDAAVHKTQRFTRGGKKLRESMAVGRGGTDMRVGIDAALALRPKPAFIVTCTDGYTPWPDKPVMGVKMIALIVKRGSGYYGGDVEESVPDWMRCIVIDLDECEKKGRRSA